MDEPLAIIMSPFHVYLAPVGTAFPLVDDVPSGGWEELGANGIANLGDDGVTITHAQTIVEHTGGGTTGVLKAVRTEEKPTIAFSLADVTPETYARALNGAVVSDIPAASGTPGYQSIPLHQGMNVSTFALLVKGPSPLLAGGYAQFQVPKVYQKATPKPKFSKGGAAMLEFEYAIMEDLDAATENERFGLLVAQDAVALP